MAYEPLEDLYFEWLCDLVGETEGKPNSHVSLLREMHRVPFVWSVPNDDNRAEDGRDLRFEFRPRYELSEDAWVDLDCSMLEMIIALARRMAFDQDKELDDRFWLLVDNLGLSKLTDDKFRKSSPRHISETLNRINDRSYFPDGKGGLFPLEHAEEDQRDVELWYQMSAYLLENDPLYL